MTIIQLTIAQLSIGIFSVASLLGVVQWLLAKWIRARLEKSIQHEYDKKLEKYKWENKARERAISVAEYLSLAISLEENSNKQDYIKANKLSWELAMWLPEKIYKEMASALVKPNEKVNVLTTVVSVRKLILEDMAGDLKSDDIASHAPGVGKKLQG